LAASKPHAIVVGAGFTGCAIAHDLMLRGFQTTVVERGEIASGTSGRTHGLLHSGGRYCVTDKEAGIECIEENIILREIAAQCIEFNGGLFVALNDSDTAFGPLFEAGAKACGIPVERISGKKALQLEPNLNPKTLFAYTVPDGSFDPLRLALAFAAHARQNGARFFTYHQVEGLLINGQGNVTGVKVWNRAADSHYELAGDIVINATGAWAGQVAEYAQASVPVIPTPGVMVAYDRRLAQRVINRLNEPGDGDIIIPQRRMGVIGTTSFEIKDPDYIPVVEEQVKQMHAAAAELIPGLEQARMRGAYMSARPLIAASVKGRSLSRTFKCYDHQVSEGIGGLVTITGGKATTCRGMAEKTVDLVCEKLGIHARCQTRDLPLVSYRAYYAPITGGHHA
jgi:glycerol-3-phosphate dehydrogenase